VIDDLERQALSEGGAGLTTSSVMRLQLERACFSKGDLDDPRELAADIAGVLGALKGVRPARREVAEHTAPPKEYRSTFLRENEARGGHVLEKHVGKTDKELLERLKREPHLDSASTFANEEMAENAVRTAIEKNQDSIRKWLESSTDLSFRLVYDSSAVVGRVLSKTGSMIKESKSATVILRRSKSGYFILTAYVT
jgi:hypothetical protein